MNLISHFPFSYFVIVISLFASLTSPAIPAQEQGTDGKRVQTVRIRGTGLEMEAQFHGTLSCDNGELDSPVVSVTLDYNKESHPFPAQVEGNKFSVWVPVNRFRWYVLYVNASDRNGKIYGHMFHRSEVRSLLADGLTIPLRQPERVVRILPRNDGKPVANAKVQVEHSEGMTIATKGKAAQRLSYQRKESYGTYSWHWAFSPLPAA